jgi:hypothetical protein
MARYRKNPETGEFEWEGLEPPDRYDPDSVAPPHTTGAFSVPIEMYSIACETPEQIADLRQAGIEVREDGVPIAYTRQQKLRALKVSGFEELK